MEKLYNGITLNKPWPPEIREEETTPLQPPYLQTPPEIIDITLGRQLFVDDFLIESCDLKRTYHRAVKYENNPVFTPEMPWELEPLPGAAPKSGGVWYDGGVYKMWYEAGWLGRMAYAESDDGLRWRRPSLDVKPGTNLILPDMQSDSTSVYIDPHETNPDRRYKMFLRKPGGDMPGVVFVSGDGVHWSEPVETGICGDRSTAFYNPFRKKHVFSIRSRSDSFGRSRRYYECDDFIKEADWKDRSVFWMHTDAQDRPDAEIGDAPQLYNFDAVAYESIMLGMFEIHLGPDNGKCEKMGRPKVTELVAAYSRDGFHFTRPDRRPFIEASRDPALWDRGYVQSVGNVCLVSGDELWFYYIGFRGDESNKDPDWMRNGMYAHSATGLARLRRDGFASLDGTGELVTRPVVFYDREGLFVNLDAPDGKLRCELRDDRNRVVAGYSYSDCVPLSGEGTCLRVSWNNQNDFASLCGKPLRVCFRLASGALYAFWAGGPAGESGGFTAGGEVPR